MHKIDWKFDKLVTSIFDEHVQKHIPFYNQLHNLVNSVAEWFIEDNTNVYDIGTSTGKLLIDLYK